MESRVVCGRAVHGVRGTRVVTALGRPGFHSYMCTHQSICYQVNRAGRRRLSNSVSCSPPRYLLLPVLVASPAREDEWEASSPPAVGSVLTILCAAGPSLLFITAHGPSCCHRRRCSSSALESPLLHLLTLVPKVGNGGLHVPEEGPQLSPEDAELESTPSDLPRLVILPFFTPHGRNVLSLQINGVISSSPLGFQLFSSLLVMVFLTGGHAHSSWASGRQRLQNPESGCIGIGRLPRLFSFQMTAPQNEGSVSSPPIIGL
ncbi:hypothetical protein EYF80_043751 [Liparis tanakae]|uniref:Uncharacterized protein n=1 Tax=Liparis tanakae TaxID=230148 RepID=A0A4Z2G0L1_9TELE|nr:hypothetical protein EYF80_043751 [Liparis tanakae]